MKEIIRMENREAEESNRQGEAKRNDDENCGLGYQKAGGVASIREKGSREGLLSTFWRDGVGKLRTSCM